MYINVQNILLNLYNTNLDNNKLLHHYQITFNIFCTGTTIKTIALSYVLIALPLFCVRAWQEYLHKMASLSNQTLKNQRSRQRIEYINNNYR